MKLLILLALRPKERKAAEDHLKGIVASTKEAVEGLEDQVGQSVKEKNERVGALSQRVMDLSRICRLQTIS